jgi:hypothetical protein
LSKAYGGTKFETKYKNSRMSERNHALFHYDFVRSKERGYMNDSILGATRPQTPGKRGGA